MPIYEYRCQACGHEMEALQNFSEAPLLTCPACGKDTLHKKISLAGFQLKGTGWYVTDFKNPAPATSKPSVKTEQKAETKEAPQPTNDKKNTDTQTTSQD